MSPELGSVTELTLHIIMQKGSALNLICIWLLRSSTLFPDTGEMLQKECGTYRIVETSIDCHLVIYYYCVTFWRLYVFHCVIDQRKRHHFCIAYLASVANLASLFCVVTFSEFRMYLSTVISSMLLPTPVNDVQKM